MTGKDVKRRIRRATKTVSGILEAADYKVRILDGKPFHIEAIRNREIRNIRITIDEILAEEERLVSEFDLPDNCSKEIWCREESKRGFNILKIF